jgi:hypothetical protein
MKRTLLFLICTLLFLPGVAGAKAQKEAKDDVKNDGKTQCTMAFQLKSWSVFYKSGKGHGTIHCDNGQSAKVKISTHGGGVTFGENTFDGKGSFSRVKDIKDLFGGYAQSEAHAGASGSADANAMWNGDILLTLSGTGKGWDLGFDFGKFKIAQDKGDKKKDKVD